MWHFARGTTYTRNDGTNYFLLCGCKHLQEFIGDGAKAFTTDKDRAVKEAAWDEHAEKMFINHTASWTEAERIAYCAKLWPVPPPVIPTELKLT